MFKIRFLKDIQIEIENAKLKLRKIFNLENLKFKLNI